MGQLMEVMQTMARGQEEIRQENLRAATANPILTMLVNPLGDNTPIVTQPPHEGGPIHQNVVDTFAITVQGGAQTNIDDHQDTFLIPKVDYVYDAYRPSLVEVDKKLCVLEEKMKSMEGFEIFVLEALDICLVPEVKIPAKFKVPTFEKYKGVSCSMTHVRSYCRKMAAYSDDEKLLMHFFHDSLSGASLEWYMQLEHTHLQT